MKKIITPNFLPFPTVFLTVILTVFLTVFGCLGLFAQTGIGTTTPDPQSILDIVSTQKGLLLPRLTTAQQATLAGILSSGETGMLIRDSVTGKVLCWAGAAWKDASGSLLTAAGPLSISSVDTVALNPGTSVGDLITWDGTNWVNMQPAVQHFSITEDNRQPLLTLNYCIALNGVFPSRSSSEPFLGEIEIYSFNFAPKGFAMCNGQLLPINQNQALFSLLGTFYGGNGTTTFALPNFQGRVAMSQGNGYVQGQTGGSETTTITR
jgi:microcystin-dependent protein